jgi:xanthine dehydrogenase accessory factor
VVKEIQTILRRVRAEPGPWVLATLVNVEGSSYRRAGARALISANGDRVGSISGGCLEEDILLRARRVAQTWTPEVATYDTTSENDLIWGVGLGCHGIVRVLIEPLVSRAQWLAAAAEALDGGPACNVRVTWIPESGRPLGTELTEAAGPERAETSDRRRGVFMETFGAPTGLFVYGAGDDAQPLVQAAGELGWRVTVADPRPAYATVARFPAARHVVTGSSDQLVESTNPGAGALAVVMTHHYIHDLPLLRALWPRPLAYLGLLGPKKRAQKMMETLGAEGLKVTPEMSARLFAPVGLDLGAEGAEEIALSILAEMKATLADRSARPLRERVAPIHDEQR